MIFVLSDVLSDCQASVSFACLEYATKPDNEAAVSSLIRGAARPEDLDKIASMASTQLAGSRCRVWWEWIDSKSNPSDGLSRVGIVDEWVKCHGIEATDLGLKDWSFIFEKFSISRVPNSINLF